MTQLAFSLIFAIHLMLVSIIELQGYGDINRIQHIVQSAVAVDHLLKLKQAEEYPTLTH